MTEVATIVPRVAFVINLGPAREAGPTRTITTQFLHLFRGQRLPATWAVSEAAKIRLIQDAAAVPQEIALAIDERSAAASQSAIGLAEKLGAAALIATGAAAPKPRPLPCGMWLLAPHVHLPKRRIARWLPSRAVTLMNLLGHVQDGNVLVGIDAAEVHRSGRRGMNALEKLLREVSSAVGRKEIQVTTVSGIVAQLNARHIGKPQRSILRRAA